ncbi:hypothetical protein A2976_00955 [candidate division WWE3 bacterium RIFCSPLOWO2_01_FULL_41_9]|uniref:Uncharacterized protein n=1 Tax=candidate division WWE3 bacterium RIFCSPLOWO2_01_FULL_41_9 TaxID=1802626 RepID=A0A1F4VLR8_UNCKA|nr:MAG: hypothetical protein A2976_00955 [candidate division WWE3 bacterium RIFCSPLOWO2_01_FULL_41_9]
MPYTTSQELPEIVDELNDPTEKTEDIINSLPRPLKNAEVSKALKNVYPDEEFIGWGSEAIVIADRNDPETVVAYHLNHPSITGPFGPSKTYHINNVLHNIFPHNFPKLKAVWGGETPVTFRRRILEDQNAAITYPIESVLYFFESLNNPLQLDIGSEDHFIKSSDGGEYYVDLVFNNIPSVYFTSDFANEELFTLGLMEGGKLKPSVLQLLDEKQKTAVLSSLERLKEISVMDSLNYILINPERFKERFDPSEIDKLFTKVGIAKENKTAIRNVKRVVEKMTTDDISLKNDTLENLEKLID